jgi:hypothetical protein
VGDVALFNLDAAAFEAKWGTAAQMRSIPRLAKQIAYGATAVTTTEAMSAVGLLANVPIPAGTIIKTKAGVAFQTLGPSP